MENNKQIPFRFNEEELEGDFKELFSLQSSYWSTASSKNKAIICAIKIAAAVIKKKKTKTCNKDSEFREKIEKAFDISLPR